MSVRKRLELAKTILQDKKVIKAWEEKDWWKGVERKRALDAIDRALERYKKEAERVKKYQKPASS